MAHSHHSSSPPLAVIGHSCYDTDLISVTRNWTKAVSDRLVSLLRGSLPNAGSSLPHFADQLQVLNDLIKQTLCLTDSLMNQGDYSHGKSG